MLRLGGRGVQEPREWSASSAVRRAHLTPDLDPCAGGVAPAQTHQGMPPCGGVGLAQREGGRAQGAFHDLC